MATFPALDYSKQPPRPTHEPNAFKLFQAKLNPVKWYSNLQISIN